MAERDPTTEIDSIVWRAIVGNGIHARLPLLHSVANYFPQGHFEQCFINCTETRHTFCFVTAINFYCHRPIDELFVRISLSRVFSGLISTPPVHVDPESSGDIIALAVKLKSTDVFYDGSPDSYTVPANIAQMILPPVGETHFLTMKDVHGISWQFAYHYAAALHSHYFTQGWRAFTYCKALEVNDSVVFMRRQSTGELLIGVRRVLRPYRSTTLLRQARDAMQQTLDGKPFMVDYYPNGEQPAFVVDTGVVSNVLCNWHWVVRKRIKMRIDNDDLPEDEWQEGTVMSRSLWRGYWRSLEVNWDRPFMNRIFRYQFVNPWNVEMCPCAPNNH